MSFEQVIYMIKHKNLNNLLPVTAIRTITDRDVYLENDYNTLPIGLLQEQYPELPDKIIEHLYYEPNSFEGILYYDLHAMTLFHTLLNISENKFIDMSQKGSTTIRNIQLCIQRFNEIYRKGDYRSLFLLVPESYRIEFFCKTIENIPEKNRYETFLNCYSFSDFGSEFLDSKILKCLMELKTDIQKKKTKEILDTISNTDILHIYRGIGSKSNIYGYSYSLSPNIARFFAFRYSNNDAYTTIMEADIKKSDIIEFIEAENEIITLPDNLKNVSFTKYLNIEHFLDEKIAKVYFLQRDIFYSTKCIWNLSLTQQDHNEQHMLRVLMLTIILSVKYNVKKKYLDTIFTAAMFHDIKRKNEGEDTCHGYDSYQLLCQINPAYKKDTLLKNLMIYHCMSDQDALRTNYFTKKEEWMLYLILKDADALDRQRFRIDELDISFLRLPFSKDLLFAAFQLTKIKM